MTTPDPQTRTHAEILTNLKASMDGREVGNVIPGLKLPLTVTADAATIAALDAAIDALLAPAPVPQAKDDRYAPLANFSDDDIQTLFVILSYTQREPHRLSGLLKLLRAAPVPEGQTTQDDLKSN